MGDAWAAPTHTLALSSVGCGLELHCCEMERRGVFFSFYSFHSVLCKDQWKGLQIIKLAVAIHKSILFQVPRISSRKCINNKSKLAVLIPRVFMP